MKDPVRLRDSASGSADGVRDLLGTARKTRQMTGVERARIVVQGAKIAAMPAGGLLAPPSLLGAGKLVAGVIAVVVGAKAIPAFFMPDQTGVQTTVATAAEGVRTEVPSAFVVPEMVPSATVKPTFESLIATAPDSAALDSTALPSKPVVRQAKPVVPTPVETTQVRERLRDQGSDQVPEQVPAEAPEQEGDELTREARQLGEAARVIATNPGEAIERFEAHRLAFPRGKLGIEREVLIIDALMRAGRQQEARVRGDALLLRAKGSFHETRVRRMLEKVNP